MPNNPIAYLLSKMVTLSLGLPWFELAGELWKIGRKLMRGLANEGVYEVLEFEGTLEILDAKGKRANLDRKSVV